MDLAHLHVVFFTIRIALLAVALLLVPGLALAWLLAKKKWIGKSVVETLIALPLVMPPVATGLILLKLLGRRGVVGRWFEAAGIDIVFTWRAVVVAMMVMSLPLLVRSARVAFEQVDSRLEGVARTLGASELRVLWTITLPLALRGIAAGVVLAFARALGEFGATILVAGNIPRQTSTISLTIYRQVQAGQDDEAMQLLAVSVVIAFLAVWISEALLSRRALA